MERVMDIILTIMAGLLIGALIVFFGGCLCGYSYGANQMHRRWTAEIKRHGIREISRCNICGHQKGEKLK
jgi:hypothetical protein